VPASEDDLPFFDRHATSIEYDGWYGQRLLDREGTRAAFPLGFGLSYTRFALADAAARVDGPESAHVEVTVANTGERAGRHVVQVYGRRPGGVRALLGFAPVELDAGESRRVTVAASLRPLQRWTADGFTLDAGEVELEAAAHSGDPEAAATTITL
jgi:beta-glucosidase